MSGRGKAVQDGVRVKLLPSLTWEKLAEMSADDIRKSGSWPKGRKAGRPPVAHEPGIRSYFGNAGGDAAKDRLGRGAGHDQGHRERRLADQPMKLDPADQSSQPRGLFSSPGRVRTTAAMASVLV